MKKIISNIVLTVFFLLILLITVLSTIGIETNRINNIVTNKVAKSKKIDLKLDTIKFKLDLKELSLFVETHNPKIDYKNILIPVQDLRVYIDFPSLLKSNLKIKKINLSLKELDITQINKLSLVIKPSNFKSFLNNKIKKGRLISDIEIYLDDEGLFNNFIAKGEVKGLEAELLNGLSLTNINLNFFADKNDILFKNIFGSLMSIKISEGDLKLDLSDGIKLESSFFSKINLDKKNLKKYDIFFKNYKFYQGIKSIRAETYNNFNMYLDKTYKVKNYNYNLSGKIYESQLTLSEIIKDDYLNNSFKDIYFSDLEIKTFFQPNIIKVNGNGDYSLDNKNFLKINFENDLIDDLVKMKLDLDYENSIKINFINYNKQEKIKSNFIIDLEKNKNKLKINKLNYSERGNSIKIDDLRLLNNKFLSVKKMFIETDNNNFSIQANKKIQIKGSKFDATNLAKIFKNKKGKINFENITEDIEIDFKNIKVPMSETLQNFKLIGEIKKGKFIKILSKGDFGGNNFLDISMKKDQKSDKKYLEIYSDLTRPLLSEYSFFKGLAGGKLLFTSIIDNSKSSSKLKIENFKAVNAPGIVKLLSLADLGGLADLAEGEGLSFEVLEISMEKNENILMFNEILALGPSISVLMEGYQDKDGLTSIRGTLVPAKTINKMISKIPVIGDIVIPKEVGEGLFGISFKMKGYKDNIKTTINPIRTLTPRFIQKIIDKKKQVK